MSEKDSKLSAAALTIEVLALEGQKEVLLPRAQFLRDLESALKLWLNAGGDEAIAAFEGELRNLCAEGGIE